MRAASGIGHRRRRSGIEMAPDRRAETKDAEQYKPASGCDDEPSRHDIRH
jgi:hypothetical protein